MSPLFGRGGEDRDTGPRSSDERERARREREARRASREGRPAPDFDDEPAPRPARSGRAAPTPSAAPPAGAPGAIEPDYGAPAFRDPAPAPADRGVAPRSAVPPTGTPARGPSDLEHLRPSATPGSAARPPAAPTPPSVPATRRPPETRAPIEPDWAALEHGVAPAPGGPQPGLDVPFDVEPTVSRAVPAPDPDAWSGPEGDAEFDFGRRSKRRRWRRGAGEAEEAGAFAPEPAVRVQRPDEAPVGVKRVAASAVASAAGAEGPPRFGAPPRGVPKSRRGLKRVLPLLVLVLAIAVIYFLIRLYQPGHGKGSGSVAVVIPRGASVSQIGDVLAKDDVVDSSFFFALRARITGDGDKLRSGSVTLKKDMSYRAAIDALIPAPGEAAQPVLETLTIPEGRSRKEEVASVKAAGIKGSYLAATRKSPDLDPTAYGAPKATPSLEGFLFPATYQYKAASSATSLVAQQLKAFKQSFGTLDLSYSRQKKLSRYDVLIIASMIEREASVAKDRPLIAAVIYNRLKAGMPLGIDATIRYRLNNWTKPLTVSELNTKSAYNTRLNTGLPPTPIGNPGLASLKAAAHPAKVDDVYYVVKPCGDGAHAFSSTNEQFQQDVAAYNAARAKRGGKDPSHC